VILVANKCDSPELDEHAVEFYSLGYDRLICVSTAHARNKALLMDAVWELLSAAAAEEAPAAEHMKLAIVGRRNAGKSTFVNTLANAERVIVSEVPGTTRDAVDVRFELDGKTFTAIDTAGIRRKRSVQGTVEFYSLKRAEASIRRADVVLLFIDPTAEIGKLEKKLAGLVAQHFKPTVFVVNKWDLVQGVTTGEVAELIHSTIHALPFAPIAFITARTGKNVKSVVNLAQNLFKQASYRVPTGELNRTVAQIVERHQPPIRHNRRPKIFYATQVGVRPPTIVMFCNDPNLFDATYQRYLLSSLRERLPFKEVPLRLFLRSRKEPDSKEVSSRLMAPDTGACHEAT
jgi:GTP-binding protein